MGAWWQVWNADMAAESVHELPSTVFDQQPLDDQTVGRISDEACNSMVFTENSNRFMGEIRLGGSIQRGWKAVNAKGFTSVVISSADVTCIAAPERSLRVRNHGCRYTDQHQRVQIIRMNVFDIAVCHLSLTLQAGAMPNGVLNSLADGMAVRARTVISEAPILFDA